MKRAAGVGQPASDEPLEANGGDTVKHTRQSEEHKWGRPRLKAG